METGLENPQVLYVPIAPGFPSEDYMEWVTKKVNKGAIHAVVLETYMSGGTPTRRPFAMSNFITTLVDHVPTFLVRQASHQQYYPPRTTANSELLGGITLETAYSTIADQVVAKIIETMKQTRDPKAVIEEVREHFRQKEWPPQMQRCGECGEWR